MRHQWVSTNDSGQGSFRGFLENANARAGRQVSNFNIPVTDPSHTPAPYSFTIRPSTALPQVSDTTTIDGTNQPGFAS